MAGVATGTPAIAAPSGQAGTPTLRRLRLALSSAAAAVLGVLPHVLHHAGPLAGAALFAGVGGSLLFGALGLVAAIPFLLRMRRRCGSWRRPLAALTLFAGVFALSTFVVGPALTGDDDGDAADRAVPTAPQSPMPQTGHEAHH